MLEIKKVFLKSEDIKKNPQNPRTISDSAKNKLAISLSSFPEMLSIRPIVVDENHVILAGHQKYDILSNKDDFAEIEVLKVSGLSEAQKREFLLKDNNLSGEFDIDLLISSFTEKEITDFADVKIPTLEDIEKSMSDPAFEDVEPKYKISPRIGEKHDYIVVVCEHQMDINFLMEKLNLHQMKCPSSNKIGSGHVVEAKVLIELLKPKIEEI